MQNWMYIERAGEVENEWTFCNKEQLALVHLKNTTLAICFHMQKGDFMYDLETLLPNCKI